jgi:hypothetical protein
MGVIVGTVVKVDAGRGTIQVGRTELRSPDPAALGNIAPGTSVTVTCEERDGQFWVTAIRPNLF